MPDVPNSKLPTGKRFSHIYLRGPDLLQDSDRARRRVGILVRGYRDLEGAENYLAAELGVRLNYLGGHVRWVETFEAFEVRDFLDAITLLYKFLTLLKSGPMYAPNANKQFVLDCRRIFEEEGLRYDLDSAGGIHFRVDAEFAASTTTAISSLGMPRFANARVEFEKAMKALSGANIDGKEAIRGVFNAVECVYKLMNSKASKLTSADAMKFLQASLPGIYGTNPTALRAANKATNAFGDWVDACHNYRHEDGVEEPSQPPLELAVNLISLGVAQLRWLIKLDQAANGAT